MAREVGMEYVSIILYALGCYMQFHLGNNIAMLADGEQTCEMKYVVMASLVWPISSAYFLLEKISRRA
jgi:hypothetical protein